MLMAIAVTAQLPPSVRVTGPADNPPAPAAVRLKTVRATGPAVRPAARPPAAEADPPRDLKAQVRSLTKRVDTATPKLGKIHRTKHSSREHKRTKVQVS